MSKKTETLNLVEKAKGHWIVSKLPRDNVFSQKNPEKLNWVKKTRDTEFSQKSTEKLNLVKEPRDTEFYQNYPDTELSQKTQRQLI